MEEVDNIEIADATLSSSTVYETSFEKDMLSGVVKITATNGNKAYQFVPYYAWDNREPGKMKVWIDYKD